MNNYNHNIEQTNCRMNYYKYIPNNINTIAPNTDNDTFKIYIFIYLEFVDASKDNTNSKLFIIKGACILLNAW